MTFVCGKCKARYQIPDRRLDGRTTMTCRDCKQPMRASRESTSMPMPVPLPLGGRPSATPSHMPSGASLPIDVRARRPPRVSKARSAEITRLGQPPPAFDARQVEPSVPHALSVSPPPLDEWHVRLRDIAVGPLRCEAIGRMLAAGTLTPSSLAWRRGFGSWLPIRQIPELAPATPEASGALRIPRVPTGRIPASMPPSPPAAPRAPGGRPLPGERSSRGPAARARSRAPRTHSIGPAAGRASSAARSLAPRSRSGSWTGTLATAFGLALLMTGAAITGMRLWGEQTPPIATPLPVAPSGRLVARTVAQAQRDTAPDSIPVAVRPLPEPSPLELPVGRAAENVQLPGERHGKDRSSHVRGQGLHRRARGRGARAAGPHSAAAAPANAGATRGLDTQVEPAIERGASAGLSTEQLSRVVLHGRLKLQRCYELALRGSASEDTVRTQLEITVSAAGGVVNVETRGPALPGMSRCIERVVRKWRFPAATESTYTEFPVVFQPGSPPPARP